MTDLLQAIRAMEKNGIRLEVEGPAPEDVGATRFGGMPDVPSDFIWPEFETTTFDDDEIRPRKLAFLAQFNCAELTLLDRDGLLPHEGLLSFFYELGSQRWGFDPRDAGCAQVFWFPAIDALAPMEGDMVLPSAGITLTVEATVPGPEDFFSYQEDGDWDDYYEALAMEGDDLEDGNRSCLLGWPNVIQNSMFQECELVSRGHYLGRGWDSIPQADRDDAMAHALEDWQLLFQLDTVQLNDFELMFGDCGRIYFYIRKADLAARRFDRVWLILQCG